MSDKAAAVGSKRLRLRHREKNIDSERSGIRQQRPQFAFALLLFGIVNSLDMAISVMLMFLVDQALAGNYAAARNSLLVIVIIFVLVIPLELLNIFVFSHYIKSTMLGMRTKFLHKVLKLDLHSFNQRGSSVFYSHISNDFNTLESNDIEARYRIATQFIRAFTALAVLAYINILILLLLLVVAAIFLLVANVTGKMLQKHEEERSKLLHGYTSYIREILTAFRLVKSSNLEKRSAAEFGRKSASVQQKGYIIDKVATNIDYVLNLFLYSIILGAMLLVIYLAGLGYLSAGYVVLVINSIGSIIQPLAEAMERIPLFQGARQIWRSIDESLQPLEQEVEETEPFSCLAENIEFREVSFAYEETPVLRGLNLKFEKGRKYLLIGPSGGGKSTILRLLRKYISPDTGELLIDNINLDTIQIEEYLRQIANVEQHVFLFEDSLRNNLTLYKDYSEAEIEGAIEAAGLSGFVAKQPCGMEQMIFDNGRNISGGEKARIAIARSLLRQSDILLLDEAFASLDDEIAKSIEKRLLGLEGVTVIQVSHVVFPETIELYDHVFEIVQGNAR